VGVLPIRSINILVNQSEVASSTPSEGGVCPQERGGSTTLQGGKEAHKWEAKRGSART